MKNNILITSNNNDGDVNLTSRAFSIILSAILEGKLKPSSVVTEVDVMKTFNLTRAPARNAITRLGQEGWLVSQSKRRFIVKPITLRDMHEIYDLRRLLEPEVARRAAGTLDDIWIKEINELLAKEYDPNEPESEKIFFRNNTIFHTRIAEAAGNNRITAIIERLHNESERIFRVGMRYLNWSNNWRQGHNELMDALVSGNSDLAAKIASRQIEQSERIVLSAFGEIIERSNFDIFQQGEILFQKSKSAKN
ncbi:MAG: GntR family transcriptional regulator [Proteobacteria bacterium]|jgi:DNA-binding GntR family transcriptional regulator|nr:GntR family transcriptional regulator [Pseudomonadota bacterium]